METGKNCADLLKPESATADDRISTSLDLTRVMGTTSFYQIILLSCHPVILLPSPYPFHLESLPPLSQVHSGDQPCLHTSFRVSEVVCGFIVLLCVIFL